jgi:hypothetical protein
VESLRKGRRLRVFENRALRRSWAKEEGISRRLKKMYIVELRDLYSSPHIAGCTAAVSETSS